MRVLTAARSKQSVIWWFGSRVRSSGFGWTDQLMLALACAGDVLYQKPIACVTYTGGATEWFWMPRERGCMPVVTTVVALTD